MAASRPAPALGLCAAAATGAPAAGAAVDIAASRPAPALGLCAAAPGAAAITVSEGGVLLPEAVVPLGGSGSSFEVARLRGWEPGGETCKNSLELRRSRSCESGGI